MDLDYLQGYFAFLVEGFMKLAPRDYDAMDPALARDLLAMLAIDRFYEAQAGEKSPPDLAETLRRRAKNAVPFENVK